MKRSKIYAKNSNKNSNNNNSKLMWLQMAVDYKPIDVAGQC